MTNRGPSSERVRHAARETRIGILCIGNPLMGDEGVGVELVPRLRQRCGQWPEVEVVDAGTPGFRLVWMLEPFTQAVLVDCACMGLSPGEWRWFRPEDVRSIKRLAGFSLHEGDLLHVLHAASGLLGRSVEVRVLGIEPECVAPRRGLSNAVAARLDEYVDEVVNAVRSLLHRAGAD